MAEHELPENVTIEIRSDLSVANTRTASADGRMVDVVRVIFLIALLWIGVEW